jgi:L-iditol 2-dehydrogenase
MKSVRITGIRRLEIADIPKPKIENPFDVLLKIEGVGLCGSDRHYYIHGGIGDQIIHYPFTIGHECAAEVQRTGPGCSRVKPGDKVVVDPAVSCGRCDQCRSDRGRVVFQNF